MRYLRSPFCKWVMPARLVSLAIILYGFASIFAATDPLGIAIALLGSFVWQGTTFFEERSVSFQLLQNTSVETLMGAHLNAVAGSWTLAKVRVNFTAIDDGSFFVTVQDGYLNGIVLPKWVYGVSSDEALGQAMAVVAHPITFVDAVRRQDTVLTAFSLMERLRRDHLPVTDSREKLVGVITREQIAKCLLNGALGTSEDTHFRASRAAIAGAA